MATLTKLLDRHARPAQVLLRRARRIALTSVERASLPHHLDADGVHLHHTLGEHRPIDVGDVLLDESGGFWIVDAAPEALVHVAGSADALLRTVLALGARHVRVAIDASGFIVVPDAALVAEFERAGLTTIRLDAPFTPETEPEHHGHHGHDHHGNDCGHDHHHAHDHDHGHAHGHD